jgi:Rad3-related DNA helicase
MLRALAALVVLSVALPPLALAQAGGNKVEIIRRTGKGKRAQEPVVVKDRSAELAAKEQALDARSAEVEAKHQQLEQRSAELKAQETELQAKQEQDAKSTDAKRKAVEKLSKDNQTAIQDLNKALGGQE